jgi:hypothetical protein
MEVERDSSGSLRVGDEKFDPWGCREAFDGGVRLAEPSGWDLDQGSERLYGAYRREDRGGSDWP